MLNSDIYVSFEEVEITFYLEHHYYDWIEDFGLQYETLFLSPRGEGTFTTTCLFSGDIPPIDLIQISEEGALLMVYGKPVSVENDEVIIEPTYIRFIDEYWYTTELFSYGRDGAEFKYIFLDEE